MARNNNKAQQRMQCCITGCNWKGGVRDLAGHLSKEHHYDEELCPDDGYNWSQRHHQRRRVRSRISREDRKFNLVIYGIRESPKDSFRIIRMIHDHDLALSTLQKVLPVINKHRIKDCHRLGRYVENSRKPRPLLVKFKCADDVANILAKPHHLLAAEGIFLKPDLSPEQRRNKSALLRERRSLINSHTSRKVIEIHDDCIYVQDRLHGRAVNGVLKLVLNPYTTDNSAPVPSHSNHSVATKRRLHVTSQPPRVCAYTFKSKATNDVSVDHSHSAANSKLPLTCTSVVAGSKHATSNGADHISSRITVTKLLFSLNLASLSKPHLNFRYEPLAFSLY